MSRALCFCLLLFCLAPPLAAGEEGELAYAIFLKVNGRPITQDNVIQVMRFLVKREYNGEVPEEEPAMANIQKAAIRDLVRAQLIHSEASRAGVKLDREYSRRAIAMSGLRPDEVTPTIRRMLEADDLFDEIMMVEGTPIRTPSPREMKEFYTQNQDGFRQDAFVIVRTIFLGYDGRRPNSFFRQQGEDLAWQINSVPLSERTEYFSRLAKEQSQDVFAEHGGRLTGDAAEAWMPREFTNVNAEGRPIFPEAMVEGIRSLVNRGEVRVVESEDGVHLLYLEDVRGGGVISWNESKRVVEYVVKQRNRNAAMRSWINRIYDHSDVKWHDGTPYDKAILTEEILPSERGLSGRG
ncbi:MAG: hypothetical protein LBU79_04105 [Planctomycetota bacterium]|jgi:hypothetical protein|nr:hypothetical protein [Planctomycetota bacterium]